MGAGPVESGGPRACHAQHTWLPVLEAPGVVRVMLLWSPDTRLALQRQHMAPWAAQRSARSFSPSSPSYEEAGRALLGMLNSGT